MSELTKTIALILNDAGDLIKRQSEISVEDIAKDYSYPEDKTFMRNFARQLSDNNLPILSSKYYEAIKLIREQKYPEVNGVKYYKEIVNAANFLSEEQKISLDNILYRLGSRKTYFDKIDIYNSNTDGGASFVEGVQAFGDEESESIVNYLVENNHVELYFDLCCENCGQSVVKIGINHTDKTAEEIYESCKKNLYCDMCDLELVEEYGKNNFIERIDLYLKHGTNTEEKNYDWFELQMRKFPNKDIANL